jgi:hypothetical protein
MAPNPSYYLKRKGGSARERFQKFWMNSIFSVIWVNSSPLHVPPETREIPFIFLITLQEGAFLALSLFQGISFIVSTYYPNAVSADQLVIIILFIIDFVFTIVVRGFTAVHVTTMISFVPISYADFGFNSFDLFYFRLLRAYPAVRIIYDRFSETGMLSAL